MPFCSRLHEIIRGRTQELEALARGVSTHDIDALFADDREHSLLSRMVVSEVRGRLWGQYEAFAGRDLSEWLPSESHRDWIDQRLVIKAGSTIVARCSAFAGS